MVASLQRLVVYLLTIITVIIQMAVEEQEQFLLDMKVVI